MFLRLCYVDSDSKSLGFIISSCMWDKVPLSELHPNALSFPIAPTLIKFSYHTNTSPYTSTDSVVYTKVSGVLVFTSTYVFVN